MYKFYNFPTLAACRNSYKPLLARGLGSYCRCWVIWGVSFGVGSCMTVWDTCIYLVFCQCIQIHKVCEGVESRVKESARVETVTIRENNACFLARGCLSALTLYKGSLDVAHEKGMIVRCNMHLSVSGVEKIKNKK